MLPVTEVSPIHGAARAEQLLEVLPQRLLVVLPDRRFVFATGNAERMFKEGRACRVDGRLTSIGQLKAAQIEQTIRRSLNGTPTPSGLWFTPGLSTGWLEVSVIDPALARAAGWPADSLLVQVHLDEPVLSQSARIDALFQQCRLTKTERYVLMLLADGLSVEAAAQHLDLQVSTLRSHVRNLLSKCGAPTLMQLVRCLGSAQLIVQ